MKRKLTSEILMILFAAVITGLIVNFINPKGIALIRDDSERFAVDSTKVSVNLMQRGKLNKAGFYQPVNIPVDAAKQLFDEGILFVDGRIPSEFQEGHIKGAINIDYKTFKDKTTEGKQEVMKDIKKEQLIVSYCGSDSCEISIDNAYEMAKSGYNDIKIYLGGYKEWSKLGYPVEK